MVKGLFDDVQELNRSTLGVSEVIDTVHDKYYIQLSNGKLEHLCSPQAEAYNVQDLVNKTDQFYALIFNKNLPVRYRDICTLKASHIQHLISPIDYSIVKMSNVNAERFCVILPKPQGKSFKQYMEEDRTFDHHFCIEHIALPLSRILLQLHQCGITHGAINPSNIYMDEYNNITLGNCIAEICGLSQPPFYETIHRSQCHPYGKGIADPKIDYYALGMTLFSLAADKLYDNYDKFALIDAKSQDGSYYFLNTLHLISGELGDLIRGLVVDDPHLRWTSEQIDSLANRREYTVVNLVDKSHISRAVLFKEKEIHSKNALAHELFLHWDDAKVFIQHETIHKWLDIRTQEHRLLEELEQLKNFSQKRLIPQQLFSKDDELTMKVILLLDPDGPIRYKNIVFYKESLGDILAASIVFGYADITQFIANLLFTNFLSYYEQLYYLYNVHEYIADKYTLERCSDSIKRAGFGYGIERCLYDLCDTLPSQSHLFDSTLVYTAKEALQYLENNAIQPEDILTKKNLLCFMASKLHLSNEIKIDYLRDFPTLQKSKELISLYLLATAQEYDKIDSLPNLTDMYVKTLKPLINNSLKSETIKQTINDSIDEVASSGNLMKLLQNVTNIKLLEQDSEGFMQAIRRSIIINTLLQQLSHTAPVEAKAKKAGLNLAVQMGYLLTCASIIFSFLKNF